MSRVDDGGKAFPQLDVVAGERDGHGDVIEAFTTATGGLSRRDYFAAAALTGVMTGAEGFGGMTSSERGRHFLAAARMIFEMADAMIAASKSGGSDE